MATILRGAPVAAALSEALMRRSMALRERGITPVLAIVRVGERPDDISYEIGAIKRCDKTGINVRQFCLPAACTRQELLAVITEINRNPGIHGCLMFRPLPNREDEAAAM